MTVGDSESGGALVTFEGGEGSGKSTVCTRVFRLVGEAGYNCWKGSEPGGTVLGACWREQILNPSSQLSPQAELFLFLADRAQNFAEHISPRLADGHVVMLDRHRDSTMAYQGAGRRHDKGLIEAGNRHATTADGVERRPDLTILLDIDPELGLRRAGHGEYGVADRIETEALAFHVRLREEFRRIAREEPDRVAVLDASRPLDEIVPEAHRLVEGLLNRKGLRPSVP